MNRKFTSIIFFLLFSCSACAFYSDSDTMVVFTGINSSIAYGKGRQLGEVFITIQNNSKAKIRVEIKNAELIRGNTTTALNGLLIKDNQFPKGNSYIYINSGTLKKVRILFQPFNLYEGSVYTIRAVFRVDGKEYVTTSVIELFRQAYGDKHKYK